MLVSISSTPAHIPLSHQTSHTKPKLKDEIIQNFKKAATEYSTKLLNTGPCDHRGCLAMILSLTTALHSIVVKGSYRTKFNGRSYKTFSKT